MTPIVVATFEDRESARRAVERLEATGTAAADIAWHRDTSTAANAAAVQADEYITGGIVASFGELLDGLLATSPPEGSVQDYRELVRREGLMVTVRLENADDSTRIGAVLREAGATRVGSLPQPGLDR